MFDLEQSIAEWRRQMLAAGIKAPVPLEELESHLREDVENRMRSGVGAQQAFETTVEQIGQTGVLQTEFAKVGGTVAEKLKAFLCAAARIPNYQLVTNMNTSNQSIEPRWATYGKTIAFILPGIFLWVGCLVFVLPMLKEICMDSHTNIPNLIVSAVDLSDNFRRNFLLPSAVIVSGLFLLEWRSRWWERRRRFVFGATAFLLNSTILLIITALLVLAVVAGTNLLRHGR
jgi:hypothetical protein